MQKIGPCLQAMLKTVKLDIKVLQQAYEQS